MPTKPENYIRVAMLRHTMQEIPKFPFPLGYALRFYRPGDRQTWARIQRLSEPYETVDEQKFDQIFGYDLRSMPRRCMFLTAPDGSDCGTITAWYNLGYHDLPWGQIHWVAVLSEHRGKGLSKSMTVAALRVLRGHHHRRAMLFTQAPRIPAIKAYLDCGFVPDMDAEDAARAWDIVRQSIRHAGLGNG